MNVDKTFNLLMKDYRFTLQPYTGIKSRYKCPSCGRPREFTRYIDTQTGELLPEYVGRCNREVNCGYHYTPKQYLNDNTALIDSTPASNPQTVHKPQVKKDITESIIPFDVFKKSIQAKGALSQNHFLTYLKNLFSDKITNQITSRFFIGSSKYWSGATIFWQIDQQGKIRSGKIMLYDPSNGKRVKKPYNHITWVHSVLQKQKLLQSFNLKQCLFGEHQLTREDKSKPVAIVESEKTAIIASIYLPEYVWLACGSLSNLKPEICRVLTGRRIVLFPDLGAYEKWEEKIKGLYNIGCKMAISNLLEKNASELAKTNGFDLADYLVKKDQTYGWALSENDYPIFWDE